MRITDIRIKLGSQELLLRNAAESDAEQMLEYLRETSRETRFLLREPEEITTTLEEEREFIRGQNDSESNLMLIGFLDGELVGVCSFNGSGLLRLRHRASLAIALYQRYTGKGIGTAMLGELLEVARKSGLEQIELEVVTTNEPAIALYRKLGFEICGTLPDNMKYSDGTYADTYWMRKKL